LSTVFLHVIPAYFIKHSVHLFTKFWSFPLYYKILILRWILTNENIQIRLTKTIFPQLPYSERLVKLYLPILEMRRVMADLTTCYKLLNGLIDIDSDNFFVASNNTRTRGNSRKLQKNHVLNIRDANMFHNRVINFWNKLPDSVVLATSISRFKRRLLSFVLNLGSEHFHHDKTS